MVDEGIERHDVSMTSEARDDANGEIGQKGMTPLGFAGEDIREVHLDEWDVDSYWKP